MEKFDALGLEKALKRKIDSEMVLNEYILFGFFFFVSLLWFFVVVLCPNGEFFILIICHVWWHTSAPYMQDKLCQHAT